MVIQKELCKGCGKCITECSKAAIRKDDEGKYFIDQDLCVNCEHIFDIECIRVCRSKAITHKDGTVPEFDKTTRLRPEHLPFLIAIMGERGRTGRFPVGILEWDLFRKIISAAFLNPDLNVRLTKVFDDVCTGCVRKAEPGHVEKSAKDDDIYLELLGLEPGTIIKFWDLINLFEDKCAMSFLKSRYIKAPPNQRPDMWQEEFLSSIRTFVSPDAKMLSE